MIGLRLILVGVNRPMRLVAKSRLSSEVAEQRAAAVAGASLARRRVNLHLSIVSSICRASISVDRHPAVINRAQTIKFTLAVYFPAYPGNSAPAVWPQNSPGSAVGVREIFGDDTFGDPADNRRVEPAG